MALFNEKKYEHKKKLATREGMKNLKRDNPLTRYVQGRMTAADKALEKHKK